MTTPIITLKEYFNQNKIFVIPNYQRGYKWAVPANNSKDSSSAIEVLMDDLINASTNEYVQYFLQGVTVTEKDDKIILIDGQQRTTSLYLILWCLGREYIKDITLQYNIREESKEFISKLKDENFEYNSGNDKYQDIYYFKKAIEQVNNKLDQKKDLNRKDFYEFLLNKVSILYIKIDEEKAIKTFTMMNGSKATMLEEELVKAEMLRMVSTDTDTDTENQTRISSINEYLAELKEIIAKDWETNALRSKYAREWDKWLYWWNKEEIQAFFNVKSPMGLLLEYYYRRKQNKDANENFCFNNFKKLLENKTDTKKLFKGLRDLQKTFEDIYNAPSIHNSLGLTLIDINDKFEAINYFIDNKNDPTTLKEYAKWRLVGANHRQVTKSDELSEDEDTKESKANSVLNMLSQKIVYNVSNEYNDHAFNAYKQLLRFNMEEDDKLNRMFDFSIWDHKTLEHIHPKSKVYYIAEDKSLHRSLDHESLTKNDIDNTWINGDDFEGDYSEHCIGNLVLLYGRNNSTFGAKSFKEKKNIYFNLSQSEKFESRNLLHTISVFAEENWGIEEIKKNRDNLIEKFKKDYGIE